MTKQEMVAAIVATERPETGISGVTREFLARQYMRMDKKRVQARYDLVTKK